MRMGSARLLLGLFLALLAAISLADNGTIQLTSLPTITVADGRSTVTLSAYVRRSSGQPVPDGTQVMFQTTLGTIKDSTIVATSNGVARAILQTGTVAGTATITVNAIGAGANTTLELEFVSDRSLLSSANEYVEIVAPGYMEFSLDQKIIGAAGPGHGAKLRYREIEIDADDLQLNIPAYEVRAKKAHLKMGKVNQDFEELSLKLSGRKGVGTTTIIPLVPVAATAVGEVPLFVETHPHQGIANIRSSGTTPIAELTDPNQFRLEDLSDSTSMVSAKKAIIFPQKKIQFQRASVMVGGVTVMKMPLYEVSLNSASNIITDQMFGIQNNALHIDYPYYLTMKPGETSLFRFSTGQTYGGNTFGADRSLQLGYELAWNRGDEFDGGLALIGTSSRTWDLSAHQYVRFDERTSGTAFFDMPQGQSAFASLNFNKQLVGYGMNVNASESHTLRGNRFNSSTLNFIFDKDPMKLGDLPAKLTVGLNASASDSTTNIQSASQSIAGVHARVQMNPWQLGKFSQFNSSFTATEQTGHNSVQGLAFQANAMLSRQFGSVASAIISYDYLENGFNSGLTGRHQLSLSGQAHRGNFSSTLAAIKALDVDRVSLFADSGYQLSRLWRLSYSYTLDRYIGNTYVDYLAALGFRVGSREIGLTYSGRTKHFGIQLLGAPIGN